jgi:hypothetical protein
VHGSFEPAVAVERHDGARDDRDSQRRRHPSGRPRHEQAAIDVLDPFDNGGG